MSENNYQEESKQRWGNTTAYKQSVERTKNWKKEDYERVKKEGDELMQEIVKNMEKGIESPEIQKLIQKWRENINQFYDTTLEMCQGLADMYIADKRFTEHYEKYQKGLAKFMHEAIGYYCKANSK